MKGNLPDATAITGNDTLREFTDLAMPTPVIPATILYFLAHQDAYPAVDG